MDLIEIEDDLVSSYAPKRRRAPKIPRSDQKTHIIFKMINIDHDQLELRPEYIDMHKEELKPIIRVEIADSCYHSTQTGTKFEPFIRKSVSRPPLRPERNHADDKPFERKICFYCQYSTLSRYDLEQHMFTKHAKSHALDPKSKMMKVINPNVNMKMDPNSTNQGRTSFIPTILRKAPDIQIAPKPITATLQSFRIINVSEIPAKTAVKSIFRPTISKIAPKNKICYLRPGNIGTFDAEQKIVSEKTPSEKTQSLFLKNDSFKVLPSESTLQSSSNDCLISSAIVCPHNNNLQT